ncbi:MAG: RNA polymerase sigma factor [Solirubrobacteraceae bacterium]
MARLVAREGGAPFAELYERYHQALYRYCRSIVRDEHDAQDALQNAMVGAFAALRNGERDLALRPWLFRIAHNESVSLLRRRRPQEIAADELALLAPSNTSEPPLVLEQRERLAMLMSDLRGLTIRQRSALVMRELSGLSIEEIAAASSSTPGAVKQTLFEAREALRQSEQGRSMDCEQVRRLIHAEDRRALRARRLRSHLRSCADCRQLGEALASRRDGLSLLAPPLPPAAAAALLSRLLDTGAGASVGAASAASTGTAASGAQAASAGSSGTGATTSGLGTAAASGGPPSVLAHAGGAIVAKALTAGVILAAGAAGVAGVAYSGSSPPDTHHPNATRHVETQPSAATHPDAGASSRQPRNNGVGLRRSTSGNALTATHLAKRGAGLLAHERDRGRAGARGSRSQAQDNAVKHPLERGRSSEAHQSPGRSAQAPGNKKTRPNASNGPSHGHQAQPQHIAAHGKPTGKGRSKGHGLRGAASPHASSKSTEHGSTTRGEGQRAHAAPAHRKSKPSKQGEAGSAAAKGEEKQPAASGAPGEGETPEAPTREHGRGTR